MIKKILREELAFNGIVNEVDWDNTFSDVKQTCVSPENVVEYLNKVIANAPKSTNDREKFDAKHPFIHSKSSFFDKDKPNVDIESFIARITEEPNNVVNTNEKMLKSGGPNEYVYKTGLPALRGIAYDIEHKKFHYINTCPGAGSCAVICYALKGNYVRYPASYDSMTKRLNLLLNNPSRYEERMYEELKVIAKEYKAFEGYKAKVILRWNDSGDFFTKKYVDIANSVMSRLKKEGYNVESYAYTKIGDVATSDTGFDTTFSQGANKRETGKVDVKDKKSSLIIPKTLSNGIDLMKLSDEAKYKERVADFFNYDLNTVITYEELMQTPKSNEPKWNVIVTNENGDDAAFRKDVKNVLLKFH
jgi:hypothetical protein